MAEDNLYTFKLVLLGETAVGKSSLVLRFVKDEFSTLQESTIGAAFFTAQLQLKDDTIKFEIWDTAGQERYQSLAPMYYRNAKAAIVVYDITDWASFERAKKWVNELISSASLRVVIALCGNKADLSDDRKVPTATAQAFAEEHSLVFMETSAKTNQNVKEVFEAIAGNLDRKPSAVGNNPLIGFDDESDKKCSC